MDREALVRSLGRVLRERSDVAFALLFGSQARGDARQDSDVDVAVASQEADLCDLSAQLSAAVGAEVHVIRLDDDVGVPLLEELIEDGVVVFEAVAGAAASWRSHALADLEIDRPWFQRMSRAWLARVAAGGIVVNLMLAVQCCADIASHLIADEGWPTATSLAGSFERLRAEGVLTAATAGSLSRAAGVRNIVAHGDSGVDVSAVHQASVSGVADLARFATEVAVWVQRRASDRA
ncbi:MAG TPA: DUF86 domain-containing protein [Polyangiaceae bacterium]|nr:DUF86 domain-containing protein [Polyangiaceae bacterium]